MAAAAATDDPPPPSRRVPSPLFYDPHHVVTAAETPSTRTSGPNRARLDGAVAAAAGVYTCVCVCLARGGGRLTIDTSNATRLSIAARRRLDSAGRFSPFFFRRNIITHRRRRRHDNDIITVEAAEG